MALLLFSIAVHAQKQITHFLGIPVDGSKEEMIQKLEEKGFRYYSTLDYLKGVFNGKDVEIHVVTNRDKVYRIVVYYALSLDETDVRIGFNKLCRQFDTNPKYTSLGENYTIQESEDISYQIIVKNKRYQAVYLQKSEDGSFDGQRSVWFMIHNRYGRYDISIFYDNGYNMANGEDL